MRPVNRADSFSLVSAVSNYLSTVINFYWINKRDDDVDDNLRDASQSCTDRKAYQ